MGKLFLELLDTLAMGFLPLECSLCGHPVELGRQYPLCLRCEGSLRGIRTPLCPLCGRSLISEQGICMECRRKPQLFDRLIPLYAYRDEVRDLVIAYKGKGRKSLALFFAERIASRLFAEGFHGIAVVPVPPRCGKVREKGWDQVEAILKMLEKHHGIEARRLLSRGSAHSEQKKLSEVERSRNIRGQFCLTGSKVPDTVILLDDICTTGATLSECSRVLKNAGSTRVIAVVIAAD